MAPAHEKTTGSTSSVSGYVFANGFLIARLTAGSVYYYHQNHLGNMRLVTLGSSTSFSSNYRPHEVAYRPSGTEPVYKYTGKPQSASIGLYYYGARWYNQSLGRFLTRDPNPRRLSSPQSLNLYVYVLNNPLRYVDPTGTSACAWYDIICHGSNAVKAGTDWWNGLDPNSQQLLTLTAMIVLTVATGGAAAPTLLLVGGIGFGLGVGTYLGYTYATGGTATLSGALSWGIAGFAIATIAYSAGTVLARGGLTAGERLAMNRVTGLSFEEKVANLFGLTRNVGTGRTVLEGVDTAGKAVPDFATELLGEAKSWRVRRS